MKLDEGLHSDDGSLAGRPGSLLLLLAVFTIGLFVILPDFNAYFFGNEHYYTDSAIRMQQTGSLLTPVYADGTLRFNKPVLSCWMILAGFRAFGVSVLSSRMASLLAGIGILLMGGLLARRLFGSRAIAFTAMLILATNVEIMTASMRATPDVFLTFFSLLGLYGFAGLLLLERPRPSDAWWAYGGAGLAIAAKGMLGVVLVVFVFLFALARRDRGVRLRALIRPIPMLAGLTLAVAWFVAVYVKYGDQAVKGFMGDQVGNRISSSATEMTGNLLSYTLGLAAAFFPWSILLVAGLIFSRPAWKRVIVDRAAVFLFMGVWYVVLLIVFSPANLTRTRYLLPGFPFLAVGFAALLVSALEHPSVERTARRMLQILAALLVPVAVVFALLALAVAKVRLGFAAAGFVLLAIGLFAGLRGAGRDRLLGLLALATFVVFWDFQLLVRPVFPSTPAYEVTRVLQQSGDKHVFFPLLKKEMSHDRQALYKEKYASQVRLISGGTIRVDRLALNRHLARETTRLPMICAGQDVLLFPTNRFTAVRAGGLAKYGLGPADFRRLYQASDKSAAFDSLFVPYYIVFPRRLADALPGVRPAEDEAAALPAAGDGEDAAESDP